MAMLLEEKVRIELPLPGATMEIGLKPAVTPDGRPDTESESAESNPPDTLVEIVLFPEPPWATERLAGETLKLKSGVGVPGLKMMSNIGCISIPLGATPV